MLVSVILTRVFLRQYFSTFATDKYLYREKFYETCFALSTIFFFIKIYKFKDFSRELRV